MNTCKTCIHWVASHLNEAEWMKECRSPKLMESGDQYRNGFENARDVLIYSYSEGGYFNTGPDFGCVHHQTSPIPTSTESK